MSDINNNTDQTQGNDYQQPVKPLSGNAFSGVTVFALGQGGAALGSLLEKELRRFSNYINLIAINTAEVDLNAVPIPDQNKYKIGLGTGAGKKREYAKDIFFKEDNAIFNEIVEKHKNLLFGENRIVLVVFSSGGGTGSALGPKTTALLTKYCMTLEDDYIRIDPKTGGNIKTSLDGYRPNVLGVCIAPDINSDIDSGTDTLYNSLETMKEIDILVKNKVASFFIVKNEIPKNVSSDGGLFDSINKKVLDGFNKFIKKIGTSENNINLDVRDRFQALSSPGLYAFTDLNNSDRYGMYLPVAGSKVSILLAELAYTKESYDNKYQTYKNFVKNYRVGDTTIGWNDITSKADSLETEDIILLGGFDGLEAILEPLKEILDRKMKSIDSSKVEGNAFDKLNEVKETRAANTQKQIVDIDNLI